MKALVVDDDQVLANVVAFTLRREGFKVIQTYDGETALRRLRAEQPDLIVLNVNLPGMDGARSVSAFGRCPIRPLSCSPSGGMRMTSCMALG